MIGRLGQHVKWVSICLGPRLFPPPPLFFFQSHRCEEREGKRASEDQRTEAEERSYGRFFLFFFVCVCVCVCLCLIFDIACLSFWLQSQPEILRSLFHVYLTRERKKEQLHMRERHHACTSMCFLFMACCTKAPSNDNTNRKTKQKNGVFFFSSCCTLHISLFLSPSVLKTGFLTSTTSVLSLFFCFLVRLFHLQPFFFFSEKERKQRTVYIFNNTFVFFFFFQA